MWNCPACHSPLVLDSRRWQCASGHSFDMAKEGYVNLLLANQKNSKEPGDSKAMINARRAFLEQGYYQPLAEKLVELIQQYLPRKALSVFDAGCGEGYYLNYLRQHLLTTGFEVNAQGCDIAKIAVQKAAKKYTHCQFAVASTFHLPVADKQFDALVQVFAPVSENEVLRVLKADGIWLSVNPAASHLWQLKQALYDTPEAFKTSSQSGECFKALQQLNLSFDIHLEDEQSRRDLLSMTPYLWSTPEDKLPQVLAAMAKLTISFDIEVLACAAQE